MKLVHHLAFLLPIWLFVPAQGLTGQAPSPGGGTSGPARALSFGVPIERDVRSGEVHEYGFTVGAGDLISGTTYVARIGCHCRNRRQHRPGHSVRPIASKTAGSDPERLGFVSPAAGVHRLRIKAFDRFDKGGGQVAPGEPVPVTGTAAGRYTLRLETASVSARMQGPEPPVREDYSSPRLKRLAEDVKTGRAGAVQAFWQEVAGKGPLVEDIAGNDRDADVTFLWRETYDTRNVRLMGGPI